MKLIAYHNSPAEKRDILKRLRMHAKADALVKGSYWQNGKGCAVGCTLEKDSTVNGGNHELYEARFGIPQMLARLEDTIFEGLPNDDAMVWPAAFMGAIKPGTDLSCVGWQFLHWLLTDSSVNPGIDHPSVRDDVKKCADVLVPLTKGLPVDVSAAKSAARLAARSAAESARSAAWLAWSAESARSAAWSARSAAWSAESAAESAESAESAARSAAWSARSAESAAWSARSAESAAESAARSAANKKMAAKLIQLCKAAPTAV